jgi:hypothetical protein
MDLSGLTDRVARMMLPVAESCCVQLKYQAGTDRGTDLAVELPAAASSGRDSG